MADGYGMRIANDDGTNLIDSFVSGLVFLSKGTINTSTTTGAGFSGSWTGTVDITTNIPVVALYCAGYPCAVRSQIRINATTWRYTFGTAGPIGTTITYYVFEWGKNVASVSGDNYGLRLWDATGAKTFDHSNNAAIIADIVTFDDYLGVNLNYISGHSYAFAPVRFMGKRDPQGPGQPIVIMAYGAQAFSGGLRPELVDVNYALSAGNATGFAGSSMWVMDVTHL